MASLLSFIALFLLVYLCTAGNFTFLNEATNIPSLTQALVYDYIIVGGGTAGCPLAATLSASYTVLLLERGGSPYGNPSTKEEAFLTSVNTGGVDGIVQLFTSTEGVANARGRVLGGGSSVNAGFYSRADQSFIDQLGLNITMVNASYEWVEPVVASIPSLGNFQTAYRTSLLQAGILPYNAPTYDHLNGTKTGGYIFDQLGNRRPSSDLLVYASPGNITVLLHAEVQRILFKEVYGSPVAYGVEYKDRLGFKHIAKLSNKDKSEVILTAGALGSAQMLMLSGIGPRDHLQEMGIQVVLDRAEVGKQVADNPSTRTYIPSPTLVEISLVQNVGITSFGAYLESGSGYAIIPDSIYLGPAGLLLQKVNEPFSKGELYLNTTNVSDNPSVTFNYFEVPRDLEVCVKGVNLVEEVLLANAFKPYRFDNQTMISGGTVASPDRRNSNISATTINARLENYCKNNVETIWHYHGGCKIGKVVDSKFKVLGVQNLRVVDGCVFPFSPGTNPQATLMMLGRYMGLSIVQERA